MYDVWYLFQALLLYVLVGTMTDVSEHTAVVSIKENVLQRIQQCDK